MPEPCSAPPPTAQSEPFFALSLDPLVTAGFDGYIKRANPAWERLLGFTEDELRAVPYVEFIHPDDRERTVQEATRLASPGAESRDFEIRVRRRDGAYRVWLFSATGAPEQELIYAVAKDITERKAAEAAAEAAQQRLRAVTDSVSDGIVSVDGRARIVFWSTGAQRIFGHLADEVLGAPLASLIPALELVQGGPVEVAARRKDGSTFPAEITLGRTPEGDEAFFTCVVRDASERRVVEAELERRAAELERSNQELERFAYVASHDLSEPLRMIGGFVSLLQSRYKGRLDDDADEFMRYTVDGVERMQALIRDLLTYSRVGRAELRSVAVDLRGLTEQVLAGMRTSIAETGARIEVGELPAVRGDPGQLHQLLQNLIANALKFTGDAPPVIRIRAERDGDRCRIAIADEGIGLEPEYAERIFEVFQRLHPPDEYPGTGVGLAICRAIVERHGGTIRVDAAPGEGSTFTFTLPAG